ncbi:glycosyltransferase family 52 [Wohlfahrtiimonas sp. G9077]|uniref:glycosyltransferase family 52 n=1 Tax=Wohlfahrtiimonas sp. G9077 TaxID=1980118 RepID=UPI000B981E6E|nr:glycosyltransferase family 52 [Wohlfahrtiimonas sp. G9077]OYQ72711.1 hypothetical protein B9T20_08650 [Wohlfahrtiimonas sp. G9077]
MRKETLEAVFICLTPLQMVIAEAIIRDNNIQRYGVLGIFADESKHRYYFERLTKDAIWHHHYVQPTGLHGLSVIRAVRAFRQKMLQALSMYTIDTLYLASISHLYLQALVYRLPFEALHTFDDGLANIYPHSHYYADDCTQSYKKRVWQYLVGKHSTREMRALSKKHWTIYANHPNIIEKIEPLTLFPIEMDDQPRTGQINILLGQPLYEMYPQCDQAFMEQVIDALKIEHYFPHPREKYVLNHAVNVMDSPLIFEAYVAKLYQTHDVAVINVYSFFSSVLVNVAHYPFVKTYAIDVDAIDRDIYTVLDAVGVERVKLEEHSM